MDPMTEINLIIIMIVAFTSGAICGAAFWDDVLDRRKLREEERKRRNERGGFITTPGNVRRKETT